MEIAAAAAQYVLISKEGHDIPITKDAATQSVTLRDLISTTHGNQIPVGAVKTKPLQGACNFFARHAGEVYPYDDANKKLVLTEIDRAQFVALAEIDLFALLTAANYLNAKLLLDSVCKFVADSLRGKTREQIMEKYGCKDVVFTPEEEQDALQTMKECLKDD